MRRTQYEGDHAHRRLRGSYFTPAEYAEKSARYVRWIIEDNGRPALIIDRCAGTGNLEAALIPALEGLDYHIIAGTIDEDEQRELEAAFGDQIEYHHGDALTQQYNESLASRIAAFPDRVVIFYENPPYLEPQGGNASKLGLKGTSNNWLTEQMKKSVKGRANNDLANKFQWSAFNLHRCDYLVVYAPIKAWKSQHIFDKQFLAGFVANRKNFGASEGAIPCIAWKNVDADNEELRLENATIRKLHIPINQIRPAYKKTDDNDDVWMELSDGTPERKKGWLTNDRSFYNAKNGRGGYADITMYHTAGIPDPQHGYIVNQEQNIHLSPIYLGIPQTQTQSEYICEMETSSGEPAFNNGTLGNVKHPTKAAKNTKMGEDNLLNMIPLFVANCYQPNDYTEIGIIMKSGDGGIQYQSDPQFLADCFVWTGLSHYNHCISDETKRNEYCFCQNTKADAMLAELPKRFKLVNKYGLLFDKWMEILSLTKDERNPNWTYGLCQLGKIATCKKEIKEFKQMIWEFYDRELTPKLFEYQLLK